MNVDNAGQVWLPGVPSPEAFRVADACLQQICRVTAAKRMQLRRCADWLSNREKLIAAALEETAQAADAPEAEEVAAQPLPG